MRLEIRGGRVVDPKSNTDELANIYIADGQVVALGQELTDFESDHVLDATGLIACPGLIELGAYIGEPGEEHRGTIASESRAAVAGGVTTLCMQPNTQPIVDTPAVVELINGRANDVGLANIECMSAMTAGLEGTRLAEMHALEEAGCIGVTNTRNAIANTEVMRRALDYAATFDLTVFLHCEDPWLAKDRLVHSSALSFELGLDAVPEAAETVAVARELLLVEQTGARAHFSRLSTGRAVQMVAEAAERGLAVTADVGAAYLFLSESAIDGFDSRGHVRPPFRTERDRDLLRAALAKGTVTAACADHQPCGADAKLNPFPMTKPGISGLETLLALLLRWGREDEIPLLRTLETVTSAPAEILGINRGYLAPGAVADICLFDPNAEFIVDSSKFLSQGKNTPFDGWQLSGRVMHTVVDGEVVYEYS